MAYQSITQFDSKNFTPAAQSMAVFGYARNIQAITIHHWGNKGQDFDTVVNFLCTNNTPTSAHYVVMAGKVACIVNPADVAWHSGSAKGNATTIGIELHPEATDADYATAAELIKELRAVYGNLPLLPHNYWFSTACPGDWDLNRLDSLARSGAAAPVAVASAPAPKPAPAPAPQLWLRTITNASAFARVAPYSNAAVAVEVAAPGPLAVKGYVSGQDPYGTGDNAWYVTKSGYYVWANAASNDISGLPYLGAR